MPPSAARRSGPTLKQLYDSVVEEDLPDSFKDLLDRLDGIPAARGPAAPGGEDTNQ